MKTLLVAATKAELTGVFSHFNLLEQDFVSHKEFDILITGVGMTATAFALGKYLSKTYTLVLNAGIAGSFNENIPLGSLVNIVSDTFAELGAEDHDDFLPIEALGFGQQTLASFYETKNPLITQLPKVSAITVNKVHGNAQSISQVKQRLNPQVESMEGAAVFYACQQMQVNCLQVRAISNYVTPRNKADWQIGAAIQQLNNWVIDFFSSPC
jgi:futalosine hydrolase